MTQDFVKEKGLQFIEGGDTGDFWGGVDTCGEHFYELFFTAGAAGPSPAQIERYGALYDRLDEVLALITERCRSHVAGLQDGLGRKWRDVPVQMDIVNVGNDGADGVIEICCTASRGFFIFARRLTFSARLRDNRLISFEAL